MPVSSRSFFGLVTTPERVTRARPFVVVGVLALLIEPFTGGSLNRAEWLVGIALAVTGLTITVLASDVRAWWGEATVGGMVWLTAIAVLRDASGGAAGGYATLLLLPVLWFSLYATRAQLWIIIFGAAIALASPLILSGGPRYPSTGWRSTLVLSTCGAMFGLTVQALRDRLAERTREVAANATELRASLEAITDPLVRYLAIREPTGRVVDLRCVFLNQAAREMLGSQTLNELLSVRGQRRGSTEDIGRWLDAVDAAEPSRFEMVSRTWRPGRILICQLTGVADGLLATWRDVTAERRSEDAMRQSMQRWQSFADAAADVSLVVDEQFHVVHVSASIDRLLGVSDLDVLGHSVLTVVHPDDLPSVTAALSASLASHDRTVVVFRLIDSRTPDTEVWLEARLAGVDGDRGREVTISLRDVTTAQHERTVLTHQATHDPLTGLLNRSGLQGKLQTSGRVEGRGGFLLYIDLDRFKPINDQHGHAAGDLVLVETGRRLNNSVRSGDAVARIGGDEFAVVGSSTETPLDIDALTTRMQQIISQPITLSNGTQVTVGASIGAATILPTSTIDELLVAADLDMYDNKSHHDHPDHS